MVRSKVSINISQRKYMLDLLAKKNMLKCRLADTPMDSTCKLVADERFLLDDPGRYRRLVGKLIYLTITRPDIAFPVSVVSQLLVQPRVEHWEAVMRILRYFKRTPARAFSKK